MAASRELAALVLIAMSGSVFLPSLLASSPDDFLQCLYEKIPRELVYPQSSSNFMPELLSSVQNAKFVTNTTVRPLVIVTPSNVSQVQVTVRCGRLHGVRLRVRGGGHDYEGLSYRSVRPEVFAVLDLARLHAVSVCAAEATAWVESGATLGALYYAVGKASPVLAFPAGACPTVGVAGYLSGGGIGLMMRKYGTGGDNVIDAKLVNANGDVLDRAGMGEDVFWAIRGGGGESFGVVVSWTLKLSAVPPAVTVFNINKYVDQGAAAVLAKWESIILQPFLPDLTIRVTVQKDHAGFQGLFLGPCARLLGTMRWAFPELGVTAEDCHETSWLRAMAFITTSNETAPVEAMLKRTTNLGVSVKQKSDYVRRAVGEAGWESIFRQHLAKNDAGQMILEPHGGVVGSVIPDHATPYPHRSGVLYNIQYAVYWGWYGSDAAWSNAWLNGLYGFMEPLVSSNPREAFASYRDLDIGQNDVGGDGLTTYESGRVWGEKYFMGNFRRLAVAKGQADPGDYFRNEQSIPPLVL